MARSVSVASGAILVAYEEFENEHDDPWAFDWFIESVQDRAREQWPSFEPCDEWLGREDHAVLENRLGYIGVSSYCGLVSIWFAPKEATYYAPYTEDFAQRFAARIKARFHETFGTLRLMGRFSNGEAVFERIERTAA